MPKKYQGESEASTASKKERMKIKKKKHLPFVKSPVNLIGGISQFGVLRLRLLKKREAEEKEKERKRNEEYRKRAKRPSS